MVVYSMDRVARNLDDLRHLVKQPTNRGIHIELAKVSLTFTGEDTPMANLLMSVIEKRNASAVALKRRKEKKYN